ncbi:MAG: hypothetical protein QNJ54_33065 [Prochloraceae cyanobacterium]|nr:hypothetical protein [Prochloraceae cyanobacterium]
MPTEKNHNKVSPDSISERQGSAAKAVTSKRMGRPPKSKDEKYRSTHIFFHPKIIEWAKAEAERRGTRYQSVINETLLEVIDSQA